MDSSIALYADISGNGPPTKNTPGAVGQRYVDQETGLAYECVEAWVQSGYKIDKAVYNWKPVGLDPDSLATDAEVAVAVNDLREEIIAGGGGGGVVIPSDGHAIWAELVN